MSNYRGKFDGEEGNTYGQRGGVGATRGKKASTYEATLPDGTVVQKKSFHVDTPAAWMSTYQTTDNKWHAGGIYAETKGWENYRFVEARRVK